MKIAHLIMAYKDPAQIERLINKLSHEGSEFYIHLDKKVDIKNFEYLGKLDNVRFTKHRFLIRWAGFSFTNAVLESIQDILGDDINYDFINLMSAQEYPIKPVKDLYGFLNKNKGNIFMSCEPYGSPWWEKAKSRVEHYHLTDFNFKGQYLFQSLVNKVMPKRKFPLPITLYGGNCATWWTMSRDCAEYVLDFMKQNHQLRHFAKFTWAPDEFLIPTIVMNSPFKRKVINNNLRYIDWSMGGANPRILTTHDFEDLKISDKFIARKFDIIKDHQVLDLIDKII